MSSVYIFIEYVVIHEHLDWTELQFRRFWRILAIKSSTDPRNMQRTSLYKSPYHTSRGSDIPTYDECIILPNAYVLQAHTNNDFHRAFNIKERQFH